MTPELLAAIEVECTSVRACRFFQKAGSRNSFTEHFCHDEDENGTANASSEEEIQDGVTSGGQHGLYYQCKHKSFHDPTYFALQPSRDGCRATAVNATSNGALGANWRSRPFVLGVIDGFLAGMESRDQTRFPILNEFLRVLDGVLRLVLEQLSLPGE
jgi:hypothetical protein